MTAQSTKVYAPSQPGLVPAAVARQAAEADRLIAELNAKPPAATPAQPAPPATPAASANPAPPAPPASSMAPAPAPKPVDWESRYKTLQGKYNAEITRQTQRIDQQQDVINSLIAKQAAAPTPTAAPTTPMTDEEKLLALGVKPKQIEEFGVELLMLMMNLGTAAVSPKIQQLEQDHARLSETAQTLASAGAQRSQEAVYAALNEKVPNWDAINRSDEFKEWLSFVDVFAGTSKHNALMDAFKKCDATRVVAIFQAFEKEDAARSTAAPSVDPATLISPSAPRGEAPAAPEGSGGRIWLESEVSDFYSAVRKKKVSPEEYKRISTELALAAKEGRIKPAHFDHHGNKN